jgi:hypothetical protein
LVSTSRTWRELLLLFARFQSLIGILVGFNSSHFARLASLLTAEQAFQSLIGILVGFNSSQGKRQNKRQRFNP